ncbi:hypothetical protein H6H01_24465 [Nostoc calcicola FACHB-3891]|nr:hypothetical protein [Nostoc calcicola FACHB-3891]MDZ8057599.1 hypothetical protein [Nostoc sp. EkiNYC01]
MKHPGLYSALFRSFNSFQEVNSQRHVLNQIITVYAIMNDLLKAIAHLSLLNLPLSLVVLQICDGESG